VAARGALGVNVQPKENAFGPLEPGGDDAIALWHRLR
jgi:hypothetical protein